MSGGVRWDAVWCPVESWNGKGEMNACEISAQLG